MNILLSPMDYYFFRRNLYTIQFVFEYLGHLDVQKFSQDLNQAVQAYVAVSARLKIVSDHEIVLETGFPVSITTQILTLDPVEKMIPGGAEVFLNSIENLDGEALFKVLVTHTPTRSFVGFSFSHLLGDGASFFHFLNHLVQIAQGEKSLVEAVNDRSLLRVKSAPQNSLGQLFESTGYIVPTPPNPNRVTVETLHYSHEELKEMKQRCAQKNVEVSQNDLLMADLAQRFHEDIPSYEGQFLVRCPVDYRKTLGLPSHYFGNALRDAVAVFKVGEVAQLDLPEVALRIRQAIQSVDRESVLRSLKCLEGIRREHGIRIFETMGCPGLLVSNLSKFPITKIDLGIGAPVGFHHASMNPRVALILASAQGIEVRFKRPSLTELSLDFLN